MHDEINSDEFETMFGLVVLVLFMSFGVYAMSLMVANLSNRVELIRKPDKIEMTYTQHITEDPFWFTGYQAYMFAWHMDELSYESLSYVGGIAEDYENGVNTPTVFTDSNSNKSVTLSTLDNQGEVIPQFIPWRNQRITGAGQGINSSVKRTLNSIAEDNDAELKKLYKGTAVNNNKKLLFHLELTGDYKLNNDLGNDINSGGKTFQWVLAPYYH